MIYLGKAIKAGEDWQHNTERTRHENVCKQINKHSRREDKLHAMFGVATRFSNMEDAATVATITKTTTTTTQFCCILKEHYLTFRIQSTQYYLWKLTLSN